jgi:drug/metabolite transporter (DMT)-like permease
LQKTHHARTIQLGILLAIVATFIWSGNFIVARGVRGQIPPIALAFFRWVVATIAITPFAWPHIRNDFSKVRSNPSYFFFTSLTGITLFNTCIYLGGRYSSAINLALIGTTTAPIIAIFLSAVFLQEKLSWQRILGIIISLSGILLLLSKGHWSTIQNFQFNRGDLWVLGAAASFAVYNILVRKQPAGMHPFSFLWYTFLMGLILLTPSYMRESMQHSISMPMGAAMGIFLYLGLGASVLSFMSWNAAIARLGASRTAIFGNLIPLFSTMEALVILKEPFMPIQILSAVLVIIGLFFTWKQ